MLRINRACINMSNFHGTVERVVEILKWHGYHVEVGEPEEDPDPDNDDIPEEVFGHAIHVANEEGRPLTNMIQ